MKYVFKIETKIGTKYANSPYYKGRLLWDKLTKEVQESDSIFLFKSAIDKMYNEFDKDMIV